MFRPTQILAASITLVLVALAPGRLSAAPAEKDAKDGPKKVVLIAGKKSHGPEGNRIHDYPWSVRLLKVMLDRSNVKDKLRVEYHLDGWPKDAVTLDDADTIVIISDGRDGDLYEEAPHLASEDRVTLVDKQMKRGCGLVTFHFSTFGPDKYASQMLRWNGGYFDWEADGQRKWYSAIKTLEADVKPMTPDHPVLRGVKPFRMNEEFYYNIRFNAADKATVPLLSVPALGGREPDGNVVAWARQREDGGRGFGTTCGHFYDNWKNDDFRRLVLNAIAWTARADVPEGGVESRYVEHDEIKAALEEFKGPGARAADGPAIRVLMLAGNEAHKWHNWERTTPAIKALLERDPRVRVDVSLDFEELAAKKLADYEVLMLNSYCNWHDPRPPGQAAKKAFVDFVKDGGGLVLIHFANGAFHFSLPEAGASDWPEYHKIVRRVWNHHGEGNAKGNHDAFGRFTVNITGTDHPVMSGLKAFDVEDELYFNQDGAEPIEPLIVARSKVSGRDEPLAWAYSYGKGRVFQTLLGHSEKAYEAFEPREMLRRAVAWAAGQEIRAVEPAADRTCGP